LGFKVPPPFPFIILSVIGHRGYTQMSFFITLFKIFLTICNMWHAPCTHVIQNDYRLLMVVSQINILTPDTSFGHKVCCKYSNGSCKLISDIYISRAFQWYNDFFNPMSSDPSNHFLKIRKSLRTPTPKVGTHLRMCGLIPSHSPTLSGMWMWFPSCTLGLHLSIPVALVTSLRLRSW